jgi:SAM-dependent methyltransferase
MKIIESEPIYRDGLHYDAQELNNMADIPFYFKQIKKYGDPVLELACGTGRITFPVAEKGLKITGIDISAGMLARAWQKEAERKTGAKFIRADCRDFNLHQKFNLIFFPFNSIAHLHDFKSIRDCFTSVRKHLKKNGRFIIAMFNPRLATLIRDSKKRHPVTKYPNPYGKGNVVIAENNIYDKATQVSHIKWHYKIGNQREKTLPLDMRIFFPQELDALLRYNGFQIEHKYGNYDETSFNSTSPQQLIICRKG